MRTRKWIVEALPYNCGFDDWDFYSEHDNLEDAKVMGRRAVDMHRFLSVRIVEQEIKSHVEWTFYPRA